MSGPLVSVLLLVWCGVLVGLYALVHRMVHGRLEEVPPSDGEGRAGSSVSSR